ncbi:MAG: hypothetical protein ACK4ON_12830 [Bacteroidia bacterium]
MKALLYFVPFYGAVLMLWGYLAYRRLSESEITLGTKMTNWISVIAGFGGGLLTIFGIMHTMITNLGRSIAIHDFDHSSTWMVLIIGGVAALFSFLFWLKTRKTWPELIIGIMSIIEVFVCFLIMGYYSR